MPTNLPGHWHDTVYKWESCMWQVRGAESGKVLGKIRQDPSVSKTFNWLHADIFWFSFIIAKRQILLKWSVIWLKSWTWTDCFNGGPFVSSSQNSHFVVSKSNRLYVDNFRFSCIYSSYIVQISIKWLVVCLKSWSWTSHSNSTNPSVTSGQISPFIAFITEVLKFITSIPISQ